jgi:tetratricopeptide (TPR) repeat protein
MTPNLLYGWSPLFALRTSGRKLIDAPRPELFDLAADPGEFVDIQNKEPRVALDLKRRLDALMAETGRDAPAPRSANLDKETVERLAALGYIGAPASKPHPQRIAQDLADPKDKLQVYEWVQRAGELLNLEKYDEAAAALERALGADPKIPQALLLLATCYTELGRKDEAKARLDLILKDDANNVQALISLANILLPAAFPGLQICLVDGLQEIYFIHPGEKLEITGQAGDTVSLIPLGGDAEGITTRGLEYPLAKETLRLGSTRGISNVLLRQASAADTASVTLEAGLLLCAVIHQSEE